MQLLFFNFLQVSFYRLFFLEPRPETFEHSLLCFSVHQVPRPKAKVTKRDQSAPQLLELLANDRQSQAGHMLLNLSTDSTTLIREVSPYVLIQFS